MRTKLGIPAVILMVDVAPIIPPELISCLRIAIAADLV
jgi:hypothetical protein